MSKAEEIVRRVKIKEGSDDGSFGIFINDLFPIINGSSKMRAERIAGKPNSISVKHDSNVYRLDIKKIK